jgi:hypothetical protein
MPGCFPCTPALRNAHHDAISARCDSDASGRRRAVPGQLAATTSAEPPPAAGLSTWLPGKIFGARNALRLTQARRGRSHWHAQPESEPGPSGGSFTVTLMIH